MFIEGYNSVLVGEPNNEARPYRGHYETPIQQKIEDTVTNNLGYSESRKRSATQSTNDLDLALNLGRLNNRAGMLNPEGRSRLYQLDRMANTLKALSLEHTLDVRDPGEVLALLNSHIRSKEDFIIELSELFKDRQGRWSIHRVMSYAGAAGIMVGVLLGVRGWTVVDELSRAFAEDARSGVIADPTSLPTYTVIDREGRHTLYQDPNVERRARANNFQGLQELAKGIIVGGVVLLASGSSIPQSKKKRQ